MICWVPRFKIEMFEGHLYSTVFWHPRHANGSRIRGIARPEYWHTTLVRALLSDVDLLVWDIATFEVAGQALMDAMLAPLRDAAGRLMSWVDLPPWARSWNFGTPTSLGFICEILRAAVESWVVLRDHRAFIRERRLFHISWH
jgi:hypothetical protein